MAVQPSTDRFSDRANDYDAYRPGYPAAIIPWLQQVLLPAKLSVVADIGAGTGIFSGLFLQEGYRVKAVEPNAAMRAKAQPLCTQYRHLEIIDGTAEHSGLQPQSIDLITVAQAFHWFNLPAAKKEWRRILQPGGHVLLAWNMLQKDTPFLKAYAALKERYGEKNAHPDHANAAVIDAFFSPLPVITHRVRHIQWRNTDGIKGLLSSSSKVPLPGQSRYGEMMHALDVLFERYAENHLLKLEYETVLYLSQLNQ